MPNKTEDSSWNIRERALLVYVNEEAEDDIYVEQELEGLCEAAHIVVEGSVRQRVHRPTKATFVGSGKVEEIRAHAIDTDAEVVLFDCELTGIQARNISEIVQRKVVDRTQLILDIFARRARTREGQLQVEHAQLSYMMPRLMSVYTKFERQRGGIGMRGPGETKLESDRRMIRDRLAKLQSEIDDVRRHRDQQRAARMKNPFPSVAIVGYTSAGKSTLMNLLSGSELLADAMPFATLDPTTRKIELPDGYAVFLTDTVGFIRNLPTHLVAAFRATLEEVTSADLILHLVDVSHPQWEGQVDAVLDTLQRLGAEDKPMLTVYNKIDLLPDQSTLRLLVSQDDHRVAISAKDGTGIDHLIQRITSMVQNRLDLVHAIIPYTESGLVDLCHRFGRVLKEEFLEDGIHMTAELVPELRQKLARYSKA